MSCFCHGPVSQGGGEPLTDTCWERGAASRWGRGGRDTRRVGFKKKKNGESGMERRRKAAQQLPDLAFVFLVAEAKADVDVALAVLGQVLSLHQGDAQHPGPHPVLQLALRCFGRPLVRRRLVLRRDDKGFSGHLAARHVHRARGGRTKGCALLRGGRRWSTLARLR